MNNIFLYQFHQFTLPLHGLHLNNYLGQSDCKVEKSLWGQIVTIGGHELISYFSSPCVIAFLFQFSVSFTAAQVYVEVHTTSLVPVGM